MKKSNWLKMLLLSTVVSGEVLVAGSWDSSCSARDIAAGKLYHSVARRCFEAYERQRFEAYQLESGHKLCIAAEEGDLNTVAQILAAPTAILLKQQAIDDALEFAAENGRTEIASIILDLPATRRPVQPVIVEALKIAIENGHASTIDCIAKLPQGVRPCRSVINQMLNLACSSDQPKSVAALLNLSKGIRPNRNTILTEFWQCTTEEDRYNLSIGEDDEEYVPYDQREIVEIFLQVPEMLRPDPFEIIDTLTEVARINNPGMFDMLLNAVDWVHTREIRMAAQEEIHSALDLALEQNQTDMARHLLELPGAVGPREWVVIQHFSEAVAVGNVALANLLRPHVPEYVRQERVEVRVAAAQEGVAFDIHNYAHAMVTNQRGERQPLILAVREHIQMFLQQVRILSDEAAQQAVDGWIAEHITPQQRELAYNAVRLRIGGDEVYEQDIAFAATFIQKIHPDSVPQWIAGFVQESITAYQDSEDPTSCVKGISERAFTGLRGINTILDQLFVQVEGPRQANFHLKKWNPHNNLQWVVQQLMAGGIDDSSSQDKLAAIIRNSDQSMRYASEENIDSYVQNIFDYISDNKGEYTQMVNRLRG